MAFVFLSSCAARLPLTCAGFAPAGKCPVRRSGALNKKSEVGNFLLSQEAALQVPSADTRLTAGFGMFPGIPTLLWSPTSLFIFLFIDSRGSGPFRVQSLFSYNM